MSGLILFCIICFSPGETLVYEAKFSFITLGSMVLTIDDTLEYAGTRCYFLRSELNSHASLNWLFTLHDTIEVITTVSDLTPLRYEERIHESNHYNHSCIDFDHDSLIARYDDTTWIAIESGTRDMLSFWYHLRTIPLAINDTLSFHIHASMENHLIDCPVVEREVIEVPIGEFNTLRVSPQTEGKGVFGAGGGMDIWYSDDAQRYPVQIKVRMKTGSIVFKLKEVSY